MNTDIAATAPETTAANGHAETHTTAGFGALTLGSIGVVYGDIGTSPLYAFREAVVAASSAGEPTSHAVLGVISLILWALIVSGQPYDEAKAFAITPATTARRLKNLQNQAKALNMTLVPA